MSIRLRMRFYHILESIREDGLGYTLQEMIYFKKREAILMQIDLNEIKPLQKTGQQKDLELIAIDKENFDLLNLKYALKNRYLKTLCNLEDGYQGYVLTENDIVLGDLWCAFSEKNNSPLHPDVLWLELDFGEKDVYGYDMYFAPEKRGNHSIASLLLGGVLHDLRKKGYDRLQSYVMADKIPALWLHRMLGFKEIDRVGLKRFLFFKKKMKRFQINKS